MTSRWGRARWRRSSSRRDSARARRATRSGRGAMPEGDTIFRAAKSLHAALAGRTVTEFESAYPRLLRVDDQQPLKGRTIERVSASGKHLLIEFSGELVLHTHMRMNGSWHIYKPGDRWRKPHRDMRIVIRTK